MTTWNDAFSDRTTHYLELVLTETSTDSANNTSVVTATLQINPPSDSGSYNLNSGSNSYSLTFEGTTYTGNYTFDFRTDRSTKVLKSVPKTITHAANGSGSASAYGSSTANPLGSASISTKTLTLTDFVRLPSAPGNPSLTRSSNGSSITVVGAVASSAVTVTNYNLRWSYDGTTWTTVSNIGTDRTATLSVVTTATVYVQTQAISSEGTGAWSGSSSVVGVPSAPASISISRTGRNVTVTAGSSSGSGITGYKVQYDNGAGWTTPVDMVSQSYTYTNLDGAKTYTFRVYAVNAIGDSAYATSGTLFVPAGGKRYNGTAFVDAATAKRWNGSAWVELTTAKRWNGSSWTDLS